MTKFNGAKLRRLREAMGLSRTQLAYKIGVSEQAVIKWESGNWGPGPRALTMLCELFDCKPSEFYDINGKR